MHALDLQTLLSMALLSVMGILTIYSAGRGTSQSHVWIKQSVWTLTGFLAMAYVGSLSPRRIFRMSLGIYILGILSLVAVFVIGHRIGGARRWLMLGSLSLQPSELMKWITLLFVSHRIGGKPPELFSGWEWAGAAGLVCFPMLLVLKQPDLGMAISFLPILALILVLRGIRIKWVVLGMAACTLLGGVAWKVVLKPYQKQRVVTFLNPGSDLRGKGYQVNQSRIAIGAGGLIGQGFTSGSQTQLNFLPVKTTDFVFSVWAEERGFLGVLLALGLFGALLTRILQAAKDAREGPEILFCVGTASIFGLHLLVNVGMVIGALPNKGMVLPFFSAGGSSTLAFFLAMGVVSSIQHHTKLH